MMIYDVYIALGANVGDREANLRQAIAALSPNVTVMGGSRLYETAPAYVTDQPAFMNMAVRGQTNLTAPQLLTHLKQIEAEIGRQKTIRFGPRQIDLDILFYGDLILDSPDLQIPHPRIAERGFVLHPMCDLAPDLRHPVLQRTIRELTDALPPDDGVMSVRDWN